MKRILILLTVIISALTVQGGETGLFTYEGGFFVKSGNNWKEYRPKNKPGVWASYTQYNEETNYYNIKNDQIALSIPKTSNNSIYKADNGKWTIIYTTRVVYPSFTDSSVRLYCFPTGYYVRDGLKWRLYLPWGKSGLWASFDQYKEDGEFFYLQNSTDKVCVPKRADLKCFIWSTSKGAWEANYTITEIYDHI